MQTKGPVRDLHHPSPLPSTRQAPACLPAVAPCLPQGLCTPGSVHTHRYSFSTPVSSTHSFLSDCTSNATSRQEAPHLPGLCQVVVFCGFIEIIFPRFSDESSYQSWQLYLYECCCLFRVLALALKPKPRLSSLPSRPGAQPRAGTW